MMVVVLTEGMRLGSDVDQSHAITATAFGAMYQKRRCRPVTIDVALLSSGWEVMTTSFQERRYPFKVG
jgi:hypothetical protein